MNTIKSFIKSNYPIIVLLFLTFLFFNEFFLKGWVIEGAGDRIKSNVAMEIFSLRSFHEFRIPQWNPHLACGTPFINTGYHNFFYPLNWIIYSLPESFLLTALTVSAMLHIFLAGLFFFLLAESLIKNKLWATVSAVSYTFSFTLTYNIVYGSDCVIAFTYIPLWLYVLNTFDTRTKTANFLLLTLTISLLAVSGNLQLVLYIAAMCFGYTVYKAIPFDGKMTPLQKSIFFVSISAAIYTLFITAVRSIPFLAAAQSVNTGFESTFENLAKFDLTRPIALLRIFVPFFFTGDNAFFMGGLCPPISFNIYFGILIVYLFAYAFFFIWDKESFFWKFTALCIALIVIGSPLAKLQYILTGKAYLSFSRYAWLIPVPVCLLAGIAGARISGSKKELTKCAVFTTLAFIIVSAVLFYIHQDTGLLFKKVSIMKWSLYEARHHLFDSLVRNMKLSYLYFAAGSLCTLLVLLSLFRLANTAPGIFVILLFLSIDLLSMSRTNIQHLWPFLSEKPLKDISQAEKVIVEEFNKRGKSFRVIADTENTVLDGAIRLGLYKPTAWGTSLSPELVYLYGFENKTRIKCMNVFPEDKRTSDLSSVGYKLYPDGKTEKQHGCLPRVRLYNEYTVIKEPSLARKILMSPGFDITRSLILDKNPEMPSDKSIFPGSADILKDENELIEIAVNSKTDSILLLTDTYANGWQAWVDEKPEEIFRANIAFKAIKIPRGKHRVFFKYTTPGLFTGAVISVTALLGLVFIFLNYVILKRLKK